MLVSDYYVDPAERAQLVERLRRDGRADSLRRAFWVLTGRPPFEAGDAIALLMHHANTAPLPPSAIAEEPIPAGVDALVLECLSKESSHRPANAEVLWARLNEVAAANPWDQGRARAWWQQHEPTLIEQT